METIVIDNLNWFDLSTKLESLTLTNGKTYEIQAQENQIRFFKGAAVPTEATAGFIVNPITQSVRFDFATGDVIALRVNNFLNMANINHITVAEV